MLIKSGVTLFEILVVIGIIAFILSISIGFFKLNNDALVSIELERLYSCVLYLQNKAKVEQKEQYLILDRLDNSYIYNSHEDNNYYPGNIRLSEDVLFGFLKDSKGPPSNAKYLIDKAITFKNNKIIFYKDGTISSGIIYLKDKSSTLMYALTSGISHITYLRRYKHKANGWHLLN